MEFRTIEVAEMEKRVLEAQQIQQRELDDLQLVLLSGAGGLGDVCPI